VPSNLETRLEKLEAMLAPPREYLVVRRYACMDDAAVRRVIRERMRDTVGLVVIVTRYSECPAGRHTHEKDHP
jgi:hypothetical protein